MNKPLKVARKFRTNSLVDEETGVTVRIEYKSGSIKDYEYVKMPERYIEIALLNDDVKKAYIL
jgi:hypothetical protein